MNGTALRGRGRDMGGREAPDHRRGPCRAMVFRLLSLLKKQDSLPPIRGADLRSLGPIHVCSCGCEVFNVMACFEDFELVWYFLDATCVSCGNIVTVPCPVDKPV